MIDIRNPINKSSPLNHGRVAWYLILPGLDGGGAWYDIVGNKSAVLNNMNSPNVGWQSTMRHGGHGQLKFNGEQRYLVIPGLSSLITTQASLSIWLKRDIDVQANSTLTGLWGLNSSHNDHYPWVDNGIYLSALRESRTGFYPSPAIDKSQWHHLAITSYASILNGTNMGYLVYQNGNLVFNDYSSNNVVVEDPIYLGMSKPSPYTFEGVMDSFSLWNRVLSPEEVKADYEAGRMGYTNVLNQMSNRLIDTSQTNQPIYTWPSSILFHI